MRYLLRTLRLRNRNWSWNLCIILALGTWWCESIRSFYDLLCFDKVRSRHTHTGIYFRWCDLTRSHCPIRYDKMRSDEIVKIELPIGSRSDPIITRPRLVTLVYVQIRSYITLRYVYQKPMCFVTMGHDNDGDSFHDQDGRWLGVEIEPRRPHLHTHTYMARMTISTNFNSLDRHDRPSTIMTTIVLMNEVCILILICHRAQAHDADWRMIFINDSCNAPYWLNRFLLVESVLSLIDVDGLIGTRRGSK